MRTLHTPVIAEGNENNAVNNRQGIRGHTRLASVFQKSAPAKGGAMNFGNKSRASRSTNGLAERTCLLIPLAATSAAEEGVYKANLCVFNNVTKTLFVSGTGRHFLRYSVGEAQPQIYGALYGKKSIGTKL